MNAVPMIRVCHEHQNPDDYGRPMVPHPDLYTLWPGLYATGERFGPVVVVPEFTTWCPRCGCDHGES